MDEEIELASVSLGSRHAATGNTRHMIGGEPMPHPAMLRIVRYGDSGVYLYYCDEVGDEYTDTWHETVAGAMEQAEFEFNVVLEEWTVAGTKE